MLNAGLQAGSLRQAYGRATSGLTVGLQTGYRLSTCGLQAGYRRATGGLQAGYGRATGGLTSGDHVDGVDPAVTNCHARERDVDAAAPAAPNTCVLLVDVRGEAWDVVASVGLARDEELLLQGRMRCERRIGCGDARSVCSCAVVAMAG